MSVNPAGELTEFLRDRDTDDANLPVFVECGSCGGHHRPAFGGDCRQDDERFTANELDDKYGEQGWAEVTEEDQLKLEEEAPHAPNF